LRLIESLRLLPTITAIWGTVMVEYLGKKS
jgi:hypothetical protein